MRQTTIFTGDSQVIRIKCIESARLINGGITLYMVSGNRIELTFNTEDDRYKSFEEITDALNSLDQQRVATPDSM